MARQRAREGRQADRGEGASSPEPTELERRCAEETAPERKIAVADTLEDPHALVKTSRSLLGRAKGQVRDTLLNRPCLDVQVSKGTLDRALRILDALFKGLEVRGLTLEVTDPRQNQRDPAYSRRPSLTLVHRGEDVVSVAMTESRRDVERPAERSSVGRRALPRGPLGLPPREPPPPPRLYEPTGSLTIVVRRHRDGYPASARRIRDGRSSRLEDRLNEVVCEILRQTAQVREARLKREAQQRLEEEAAHQQAERMRRQWIEDAWVHDLTARMSAWRLAQDIRVFVGAVEAHCPVTPDGAPAEGPVQRWLAWARRHAARRESQALGGVAEEVRLPEGDLGEEDDDQPPELPTGARRGARKRPRGSAGASSGVCACGRPHGGGRG